MARQATVPFETQQLTAAVGRSTEPGVSISGSPTIDTAVARSGAACVKLASGSTNYAQLATVSTLGRAYYYRFAYRFTGFPAATGAIARLIDSTGTVLELTVTAAGKLEMWNAVAAAHPAGESPPTLEVGRWYVIEVLCRVNAEGKGKVAWRLDGATIAAEQEMSVRNLGINTFRVGNIGGGAFVSYTDDWAVNDDQGADENSWPGHLRKIAVLRPIADGARVGWTAGAGGTTKLYDALDNIPPVGTVLGSATNTSQIKDANANSTDALELSMAKYSSAIGSGGAGLIPPDEVKVLGILIRGGQNTVTGRGIGITLVSNPAKAEVTGGFLSEIAEADPVGWRTVTNIAAAYLYNPTVEKDVSPVVKVRKSVNTSDAIMVDQVLLLVEYEPGIEYVDAGGGTATASGSGEGVHAGEDSGAGAVTAGGSGVDLAAGDDAGSGTVTASGSGISETAGDGPTYRSVVLEDEPLLYWRLGESGNTEAEDMSGHGRSGEYRNEAALGSTGALEGEPDTAVALDEAKASYVKGLTYDPFSGTKTFEIWAKRKAGSHEKEDVLFGGSNGGAAGVYAYIKEGTDNIRLTLNGFGTTATWEHAWPADEAWVHLVFVVVPGGKATLYVNGVSQGEKTVSAYGGTAGNVRISHDNGTGGLKGAFPGSLDEFAIYEGDLGAERIAVHYEAGSRAPAAPRSRCLWGADMDGDVALLEGEPKARGDAPYDLTTWDLFEAHAGRDVEIVHFSDQWKEGVGPVWDGFGAGVSDLVRSRGAIPMKTIGGPANVLKDTLAGVYDDGFRAWAKAAAAFGDAVLLRPWWEFNLSEGTWAWSGTARAADHKAAWRRLHDIVKPIAPNVLFVWCPNVVVAGTPDLTAWWPGEEYVDWTAMDGYSGTNPAKSVGWRSAHKLFKPTYTHLLELAPSAPVAICETATSEIGGSKAIWTRNLLGEAIQEDMPRIRALVWFNWNIDHGAGRVDWPIESSPAATAAFKAGIVSSFYGNPLQVEAEIDTIRPSRVDLLGSVDPGGLPASYWLEFGETIAYGSSTPPIDLGPLGVPEAIDGLTGLRPNTTYHLRLVAENERGQVVSEDLELHTLRAPATRVLAEPIDDTLFVEPRGVDGRRSRWSGVESDAGNIAQAIKASTSAPGGHRDASWSMLRDPRFDWPDMNLGDDVVIRGRTQPLGRNVFEGMLHQFPSQLGEGFSISANAVGHQELLNENETCRWLFVKLGFDGWGEAPLARRLRNAELGRSQGKIQLSTGSDGLTWDPPIGALATNEVTEAHFAAPAGVPVAKVGYRGVRKGDWSKFESPRVRGDDTEDFKEGSEEQALTLDGTARTAAFVKSWRYLMLRALVTTEFTAGAGLQQSLDRLAVYGETGVPLQDIPGELPGVYFHDALAHMLSTGAPDLQFTVRGDGSIVPNTTFVMPDFAPMDPAPPRQGLEKGNAYFLNNWAVWDRKTFHWHPWDPDRLTWNANIAGGAQWSPVGRQAFSLLNGIEVFYTDAAGITRTAGPPGSGCDYEDPALADPDPSNPYTRRGRRRWGRLDVGFPLAYPSTAIQVGRIVLAESKMPQRSGTLIVRPRGTGHVPGISHPTIGAVPVWAVRAGDFVKLPDWPEPEPFRIIETEYDHETKTLTAQLDSGAARLSAILERTGSKLAFV
ncbi:MAG TPA: LamG-like jellyroll fold domain-containing protein [Solirubrobacterales bacterium]|nr:LamG-like jellyroll fold domain-containing protein [Solirubrobacterales bacterium]